MISEHWPELPQLGRRSVDRCDVFPVVLGVEAIYLNRRCSMMSMLCAAIGTAQWIDGRSYRPDPSKQQLCSARAIHHPLLRSWHQVRFALKAERQMSLRVMVTPFWRRPRKLDRPTAMTLWVRWSNTTYSPGDNATSFLMRIFADLRSFTGSNLRRLPAGSFFRISNGECMDASRFAWCCKAN
jgi:hypothetical protein